MPRVSGDRFSSQNLSDCEFCAPTGRRFRTARQCGQCGKALCLVCRPEIPGATTLCPDCGGGPCDDTLHQPAAVIERLTAAGHATPFWLTILQERVRVESPEAVEEVIVPE